MVYPYTLKWMGTLSGEATLLFLFASHLIRDQLLKNLLP